VNSVFNKWRPVTHDYGLIKAPLKDVVEALREWHSLPDCQETKYEASKITNSLDAAFTSLLPLAHSKMRRLFVTTKSEWVACFQNGTDGSDPQPAMCFMAKKFGWLAMRVCSTPPDAMWPAAIWEVYAPTSMGGGKYGSRRSVYASNDGGRWVFGANGEPFPFENTAAYQNKRIRDRFNREMLDSYLKEFGIRAFDDDFFEVSPLKPAIRLQRTTNIWHTPEFSLEEVISGKPWQKKNIK
jgi:hypothetical protein